MKNSGSPSGFSLSSLKVRQLRQLLHPQRAIKRILMEAVRVTKADSGSFILLNPNTGLLDIEATHGLSKRAAKLKLKPGEGVTGWVAISGKPLRIDDVRVERKYVPINAKIRAELAVPVEINGQVVGIINLDSHRVAAFSLTEEERLLQLATDAAEWMRLAWEIDLLRVKQQQLTSLLDMGQMIVSQTNLDQALARITDDARRLMKTKLCSILLLDAEGRELSVRAYAGVDDSYERKPNLRVEDSLMGVVIKKGRPLSIVNVQEHHRYQHTEWAKQEGLQSLLSVPLVFGEKVLGVLSVYTAEPHRFSNEEIKLLSTLADLSAVAIAKARLLEKVVDMEEKLRASERLSALGLLAAEIAHEIRNPLTVMQMLFHSLVESLPMDKDAARDAEVIADKMKQMNRIVDQVLGFARSSEPIKEVVKPEILLDDIVLLTRHKLHQLQVVVKKQVEANLPLLRADRAQLEQAILNLVLNAADAMSGGGQLKLSATQEIFEEKPHVVISIRDTGCGMTKNQAESLFQPFLTYKQHGTGIGLAIVKKIVENHQGKIQIESKVGKGTIFRLLFPASEERPGAATHVPMA
jgi:signal transduction histidine kinase